MNEPQEDFSEPPTERVTIIATGEIVSCIYYDRLTVTLISDSGVVTRLARSEVQNAKSGN